MALFTASSQRLKSPELESSDVARRSETLGRKREARGHGFSRVHGSGRLVASNPASSLHIARFQRLHQLQEFTEKVHDSWVERAKARGHGVRRIPGPWALALRSDQFIYRHP